MILQFFSKMAENVPQTTDAGPVEDVRDTDSGIDPGSAQSTPSQSVDSTPSSSERSTPVLSPSNPETSESFSFPPEAFSGLQIQVCSWEKGIEKKSLQRR